MKCASPPPGCVVKDSDLNNLAAGTYTLQLNWEKSSSTSYTIALA